MDDNERAENLENARKDEQAMDSKLAAAVNAPPDSDPGLWLTGVLRIWNADPDTIEESEAEEARLAFRRLKALFVSDINLLAKRLAGVIARVGLLDLLHVRLYGRKINAKWFEDYREARAAGKVTDDYQAYLEARQDGVRQAGHDWPYSYVERVEAGSSDSFRSFVITQLDQEIRELLEEREAAEFDLGIVLVHGIGTQGRGETLQHFGDSILEWLSGWLRYCRPEWSRCQDHQTWEREPVYVAVDDAHVKSGGDDPAYASLSLPLLRERWLFTEAWWADELHVPSRSKQVGWLLRVIPIAMLTHLARLCLWRSARLNKLSEHSSWMKAVYITVVILAFLTTSLIGTILALLLQLIVIVVGIAAIFPIQRARALLSLLQSTAGDSLSFTESPIASSAIISRVRSAIKFTAKRSRQVAVVAHSQGAAIAHRALRANPPTNVKLLATVGAGIDKLEMLHRSRRQQVLFEALAVSICAAPLYLLYATTIAPEYTTLDLYLILFFIVVYVSAWSLPLRQSGQIEQLRLPSIRWFDFYAKSDPVPNGPIALHESDVVSSQMVENYSSALRDHTSYWQNRDEFVASLVGALAKSDLTKLNVRDNRDKVIETMKARRKQRLFWLQLARRSFALTVFVSIIAGWGSLVMLGRDEIAGLVPAFENWLREWASKDPAAAIGMLDERIGQQAAELWSDLPYRLTGMVGIVGILAAWYLPTQWLWRWWNTLSMRSFAAHKSGLLADQVTTPGTGAAWLIFLIAVTAIQLTPLTVVVQFNPVAWVIIASSLGATLLAVLVSAILSNWLHLSVGASQMFDQSHVPTARFMLAILLLIAGMWWTAANFVIHGNIHQIYQSLFIQARQLLTIIETHPVTLLPFMIYMLVAISMFRRVIDAITEKADD